MDTTKLVVGQDVQLLSGDYEMPGTVVKFTPDSIEVKTDWTFVKDGILHFDASGESRWNEWTMDNGAWFIADICSHVHSSDGRHCDRCCAVIAPMTHRRLYE